MHVDGIKLNNSSTTLCLCGPEISYNHVMLAFPVFIIFNKFHENMRLLNYLKFWLVVFTSYIITMTTSTSTIVTMSPFNPLPSVQTVFHIMPLHRHLICYAPHATPHPSICIELVAKSIVEPLLDLQYLSDNHLLIKAITIPQHAFVNIFMALGSAVSST